MAGEPGERRGAHGSTGEGAQPGPPPPNTHPGGEHPERAQRGRGGGSTRCRLLPGVCGVLTGGGMAAWGVRGMAVLWGCYGGGNCTGRCAEFGDFWGVASHLEVLRARLFGEVHCTRRSTEHGFFLGGALHPELYRAWWVLGGWHHTLSYTDHSIFWGWHHNPKPPRAWQSLRAACTAPRAVAGDFWGGSLAP